MLAVWLCVMEWLRVVVAWMRMALLWLWVLLQRTAPQRCMGLQRRLGRLWVRLWLRLWLRVERLRTVQLRLGMHCGPQKCLPTFVTRGHRRLRRGRRALGWVRHAGQATHVRGRGGDQLHQAVRGQSPRRHGEIAISATSGQLLRRAHLMVSL